MVELYLHSSTRMHGVFSFLYILGGKVVLYYATRYEGVRERNNSTHLDLRRKSPLCPSYKRFDGPQSRSRRCGEEKNILSLAGIDPDSSVFYPVI
jgi:hypothetical protein